MEYIPDEKDEGKEFIEKRSQIYDICSSIFDNMNPKKNGNGFPKKLWKNIDEKLFEYIIKELENKKEINKKEIDKIYSIEFINNFLKCASNYYPSFKNHSIIPNSNGKFYKFDELYDGKAVPKLLIECFKECKISDINDLIHEDITSIDRPKKNISDYHKKLNEYFSWPEEYSSKKTAAEYLIRINPKDKENKQNILFDLYKTFTKKEYETEILEDNEDIWDKSNELIYDIIIEIIEKNTLEKNTLKSLMKYLNKNEEEEEETIEYLCKFLEFTSNGKIILNQNKEFCKIDELYKDGDDHKKIPSELKDISEKLGYDIRHYLVHEKMKIPLSKSFSYRDICDKIDNIIKEKYEDIKNHNDRQFKEALHDLIEIYFEENKKDNLEKLFQYTYKIKHDLQLNVILTKNIRENVVKLTTKYGGEFLPELIKNPEVLTSIKDGKLSDKNIKVLMELNEKYNIKGIDVHDFLKNSFNEIIEYGNDLNFGNPICEKNGLLGEEYIYNWLLENYSDRYDSIEWVSKDESRRGEHYDILVETKEHHKIYIEVKSTGREFGSKVPFYLSEKQIEMMKKTEYPDEYNLAVVFNVNGCPKHFFMTLKSNMN